MWRSWLTHVLWEHEIVGSNPTTPTTRNSVADSSGGRSLPSEQESPRARARRLVSNASGNVWMGAEYIRDLLPPARTDFANWATFVYKVPTT